MASGKLRNREAFAKKLARIPPAVKAGVHDALAANAKELADTIARACDDDPKLSASVGFTDGEAPAQSLHGERSDASAALAEEGLSFSVFAGPADMPAMARWREFGTSPHREAPKNREVLAFDDKGEHVFAQRVDNPGEKARPFFYPTYRSLKKRLKSRASRAGSKAIKQATSS